MDVLYVKVSNKRRREFQIKTKIVKEADELFVVKEPLSSDAEKHIIKMKDNQLKLMNIYGEKCSDYVFENGAIKTPYFKLVRNLSSDLDDILDLNDEIALANKLQKLRSYAEGNRNNIVDFYETKDFCEIFGTHPLLNGRPAALVANLDLNPDNVLHDEKNNVKIIDYEWVFNFPLPIDFILYYSLKMYIYTHDRMGDLKKILKLAKVQEDLLDEYDDMINSFRTFVALDKEQSIDYRQMGRQFLEATYDVEDYIEKLRYIFPKDIIPKGSRIVIYGAGNVGNDYYKYVKATKYCEISGWLDKRAESMVANKGEVQSIEKLKELDFDYVLIGVAYEEVAREIQEEIKQYVSCEEKIVWSKPEYN